MTNEIADTKPSLTGVWDGVFSVPAPEKPTMFTAVLFETGSAISGTTHELAVDGGLAGRPLTASLVGDHTGDAVQFIKTYDPDGGPPLRPIVYRGVVNGDATEIEGRWTIPGNWSGPFLMIRAGRAPEVAEVRETEVVPGG